MNANVGEIPVEILSSEEMTESWVWLSSHISTNPVLMGQLGYHFDHKHLEISSELLCFDQCEESYLHVAQLYLASQLSQVADYLYPIKNNRTLPQINYFSQILDADLARVVSATDTSRNQNSFRNSLSEHLAYWVILASVFASENYIDFSFVKPNLQPEEKGPDGLALIVGDNSLTVKIISVKNSIGNPNSSISSSDLKAKDIFVPDVSKLLDEFFAFKHQNRGFQHLDEKLNNLLFELQDSSPIQLRQILLFDKSQFYGAVVANEYLKSKFVEQN